MPENGGAENSRQHKKLPASVGPAFPRFRTQAIADDSLTRLVEVARRAGAEWNLQPWRWIVVRSDAAKKRVEEASYIDVPLRSAPVILICLADTHAWKSAPQRLKEMVASARITEEQGREILRQVQEYYSASPEIAQRTALANGLVAAQQVLAGAASCGLSTYRVTEFDEAGIKTHFHIPDHYTVAAVLAVGYSEESSQPPASGLAPQEFVYQEKFGELFGL